MTFKAFETARARAAILGVELRAIRDDFERPIYVATREALTRDFASLDDVGRWLSDLEAARPALPLGDACTQ